MRRPNKKGRSIAERPVSMQLLVTSSLDFVAGNGTFPIRGVAVASQVLFLHHS